MGSTEPFTAEALDGVDLLVISNAIAESNLESWTLPTPSAFGDDEIDVVEAWVRGGGALLLVADHMPFPGAAEALAARFGVLVGNGFAFPADHSGLVRFERADGSLKSHPIANGREPRRSRVAPWSTLGRGSGNPTRRWRLFGAPSRSGTRRSSSTAATPRSTCSSRTRASRKWPAGSACRDGNRAVARVYQRR